MWRNPNHPAPEQSGPPEERGRRLAVFPRGQREELRVSLDTYEGHQFVRLQLWEVNGWPIRGKGCSIRLREVAELAEVLAGLASRLDDDEPSQPSRSASPARQRGAEPTGARASTRRGQAQGQPDERGRPASEVNAGGQASRQGFDEFGG